MSKYVVAFCIIGSIFAIVALIYLAIAIIRDALMHPKKKPHARRRSVVSAGGAAPLGAAPSGAGLVAMGFLCAASGILLGCAIAKKKEPCCEKPSRRFSGKWRPGR